MTGSTGAAEPAAGDARDTARPGEVAVALPGETQAGVYFIGRIRTPFKTRSACPRNILQSTAEGRVELDPHFAQGLMGLERCSHVWLLYWMHEARRDLLVQVPGHLGTPRGTFALRSPVRPNPIAMAAVRLLKVEGPVLTVAHVDCLDGTPLLDIKPYFASVDSIPDAARP
ncbi:MAG: tRNA (N6-threonylcarbamoyladenosine(37)-N6)-methyltransferase TrmO [Hyphomicrobiaceae bacterium]|nr:tRNA (N6-threonylcarbamoyladenosine(37)-N6)-methyltransferase TrmO [Hyphomicrobiaceae bacterium]